MAALVSSVSVWRPVLVLGLAGGILLAATLSLWAYYGTAVFFEIVRSGWMACF